MFFKKCHSFILVSFTEQYRYMPPMWLRNKNNFPIILPLQDFRTLTHWGFQNIIKVFYLIATKIFLLVVWLFQNKKCMIFDRVSIFLFCRRTSWAVRHLQHHWGNTLMDVPYRVGKYYTSVKKNFILIAAIHLLRPGATCKIFIKVWGNAFGWVIYSEIEILSALFIMKNMWIVCWFLLHILRVLLRYSLLGNLPCRQGAIFLLFVSWLRIKRM